MLKLTLAAKIECCAIATVGLGRLLASRKIGASEHQIGRLSGEINKVDVIKW